MSENKTSFDVIVVGSGASGGWACKRLAEAGLKVALLEAGRSQPDKNFVEHKPIFDLKYRDLVPGIVRKTRPVQSVFEICTEYNYDWFCNDLEEPYTTPADKPYHWMGRMRMVGGRTNVWGRVSLRFSDFDFKAASQDGHGIDWPLSYKDLAPYYDLVEDYIGVCGQAEGLSEIPDGKFQPPMPLTCQESLLRNRAKQKLGWTVTPARSANLTRPLRGRAACHYCGPCERGCQSHSYFNSAFTTVPDAVKSGNCTLITNAMAHKVLMDRDTNRATGVLYVDRVTKQSREIYARVVIVCAQAQESVRILLNSADRQRPNGLANSSGVLGHYLTAHVRSGGGSGEFPAFDAKPSLGGPRRPVGFYIARFRNLKGTPPSKKFLRGYGYEGDTEVDFNWQAPGYGDAFKKSLRDSPVRVSVLGFGEVLPRWDNFVEIDKNVVDAYGIPALRIHMSNGPNEEAMIKDMAESAGELFQAAGAKDIQTFADPPKGRWAVHEAGIARMGKDPKASVLNEFQQAHDVKNLFVMDASGFASNPCQNPTLTIMALCVRSCDYLMDEMKKGNV
jgi:choline dehydrogenase-like flavoprotein